MAISFEVESKRNKISMKNKIIKMKGGLGNQMFQYAFAKYVERNSGDVSILDFSAYAELLGDEIRKPRLLNFNITSEVASENEIRKSTLLNHKGNSLSFKYKIGVFLEALFNRKYFFEWKRGYFITNPQIQGIDYFDGYWQSIEYIEPIKEQLLKDFTPNYELSAKTQKMMTDMQAHNSVFVGIRKGDYAAKASARKHFGVITNEYYSKAMDLISSKVDNPVFHIFSNDIEWCKQNIDFGNHKVIFRDKEIQTNDFEELMVMSSCKHAIISNSTFNWWGAYLIKNPKKEIVCPLRWFNDETSINIVPKEWNRIEAYK